MNTEIIKKAEQHSGGIAVVTYRRPVEVKKTGYLNGHIVEKQSRMTIRVGLEYSNQSDVREKHESGEVERKGLPESMQKISKAHYRNVKTGEDMIGCVPNGGSHDVREVAFFVDGKETSLDEIKDGLRSSAYQSSGERDWMFLKVRNIVDIRGLR